MEEKTLSSRGFHAKTEIKIIIIITCQCKFINNLSISALNRAGTIHTTSTRDNQRQIGYFNDSGRLLMKTNIQPLPPIDPPTRTCTNNRFVRRQTKKNSLWGGRSGPQQVVWSRCHYDTTTVDTTETAFCRYL